MTPGMKQALKYALIALSPAILAGCSAGATGVTYDGVECGVALVIESKNSQKYGSGDLATDLDPILKWYAGKAAELPAAARSKDRAYAVMDKYRANRTLRKEVAKSCTHAALFDPAYQEALPQLKATGPLIH